MSENEQHELDDGRKPWDWVSRYNAYVWAQISIELAWTLMFAIIALLILLDGVVISCLAECSSIAEDYYRSSLTGLVVHEDARNWIGVFAAGWIGGALFVLKWLYHSVAKGLWHRDRVLWRLVVPFNSAVVSLFTGLLFASDIVPFLNGEEFKSPFTLLSFGFLFGYFSDNILAALQNFAQRLFGTLENDS